MSFRRRTQTDSTPFALPQQPPGHTRLAHVLHSGQSYTKTSSVGVHFSNIEQPPPPPPPPPPLPPPLAQELPAVDYDDAAITFDTGLDEFRKGVQFYMNRNKEIGKFRLYGEMSPLVLAAKDVLRQDPITYGSSNEFYEVESMRAELIMGKIKDAPEPYGPGFQMGLRVYSEPVPDKDKDRDKFMKVTQTLWDEMWTTLYAANCNLHPHVYACGLFTQPDAPEITRSGYVMRRYMTLGEALEAKRTNEKWGVDHAFALDKLVRDISRARIVHTDIKPINIVFTGERRGRLQQFMMIDMGGDHVRVDYSNEISVVWIRFINTLLLLVSLLCEQNTPQSQTVVDVCTTLKASLDTLRMKLKTSIDNSNTDLSNLIKFVERNKSTFSSDEVNRESFSTQLDPKLLAMQFMASAENYGQDCLPPNTFGEVSVYESLIRKIESRIMGI